MIVILFSQVPVKMLHFGCNYVYTDAKWAEEKEEIVYNDEIEPETFGYGAASGHRAPKAKKKTKATRFDDGEVFM